MPPLARVIRADEDLRALWAATMQSGASLRAAMKEHKAEQNALWLWGFSTEDIWKGSTCIIRGLLISLVRQVDEDEGEEETHLKTFECTNRTAVENVSAVADITALFP